jgi:hypothetical protein
MNIEFLNAPGVPTVNTTLAIPVKVDGVATQCEISEEALQDHFGADHSSQSWVAAYEANRHAIQAVARKKLIASGGQPVLLRTLDF